MLRLKIFLSLLSFGKNLSTINRTFLSDERLGAKLRVTENRCVLFNSLTYVYLALLPQHCALYAKVDSTHIHLYVCAYIYIYIYIYISGKPDEMLGLCLALTGIPFRKR